MDRDVQAPDEGRPDPTAELVAVAAEVTAPWLRRVVEHAARRGGVDPAGFADAIGRVVDTEAATVIGRLERLLATDVDRQHGNPLAVFRDAVAGPTELLRSLGAAAPRRDPFAAERFPDDAYALGPATWSDIDPRLHEPGLRWGAWKAMTVLRRRRDEGLR
ncbi:MAG TPA: hypothetical protein VIS05_05350 [Ilumatobacter sp.]